MSVAELDDLEAAVDLALKVDFGALSSDERIGAVESVMRLAAKLAAVQAAAVEAFDTADDRVIGGHRSSVTALRHRCRLRHGDAAASVRLARGLRHMPSTADALAAGVISESHARRLVATSARPEFGGAGGEAFLVRRAASLSFRDWERAVTYWEQVVDEARRDPDDAEPVDARDENRSLHASKTLNGATRVDGWLPAIGGEAFREALRRIETELFDADWNLAKQVHGDATTVDRLWRTPAQRRADALVEMAHRSMSAPANGKRPLPLVIVHCDQDTFETGLARVLGAPAPEPVGTTRMCETDDGAVLSATQAAEAAIVGEACRLVYQAPGVILDYGRSVRLFDGKLRQAMQARDRHCDHPGCEIPARRCDIDHIVEWNQGGTTTHTNGKCRCSYHHRNHKPRPG